MHETHRNLLAGLALTLLLAAAAPLESASRAQESALDPHAAPEAVEPVEEEEIVLALESQGQPSAEQATALERARLERELVLAERSARMLSAFEQALTDLYGRAQ